MKVRYSKKRFERLSARLTPIPFLYTLGGMKDPEVRTAAAYYRAKHRVRIVLLYYYAELNNYLVLGSLNRSEILTGLFVKYGDSACDLAPIAGLYKTGVQELAQALGIPRWIREKPPSPDLIPGLTDEEILGLDYPTLDKILAGIEAGDGTVEIARKMKVPEGKVEYVAKLVEKSSMMRASPIPSINDCRPEGLPYESL
jgi:NAD+ synthase